MPLENLADVFSNLFNFQCLILRLTDLTPHPRAPKLNIANFLTQDYDDYSHILHVYFVAGFCRSHPYGDLIFVLIIHITKLAP